NNSYTLRGCVHVILIWIYESIPGLKEKYGNNIEGGDVPLLSWPLMCTRKEKPLEDIYPKWVEVEPYTDFDNMIVDILNDQLNDNATYKVQEEKNSCQHIECFQYNGCEPLHQMKERERNCSINRTHHDYKLLWGLALNVCLSFAIPSSKC
ncbi:hypothetical protein HID58_018509, partial [Brassica napus]